MTIKLRKTQKEKKEGVHDNVFIQKPKSRNFQVDILCSRTISRKKKDQTEKK